MKTKFPADVALPVAVAFLESFAPFCERIVIAGSLRRQRLHVGDIEILYIPRYEMQHEDMFHQAQVNVAGQEIDRLLRAGTLTKRPNIRGHPTWGAQNKLAIHTPSGIPLDLFATTAPNWWVALVIRTGSLEMNLKLTAGALKLNRTLNAYGCGVTEADGSITPATSEAHVFELCGVPYREPDKRDFPRAGVPRPYSAFRHP